MRSSTATIERDECSSFRRAVDVAMLLRDRIQSYGGNWMLWLRDDGSPLFLGVNDPFVRLVETGFQVTLVGVYNKESRLECIAADVESTKR